MRRIAIINQKGGAGKTTTTVSLGAALAERDKRVLIIDLDPQYSATTWLAVHPVGRGVFDLFAETEKTQLRDLIQATTTPNLSLVGSSAWLVGAEKALAAEPGAEIILRDKLSDVEGDFDYVLIDCPPTLVVLSVNALTAVDEVLVPVAAQVMNLHGIAQLHQTIELVKKRLNPQLRFAGILACRLDQRTNHGPEIVSKLRSRFPETLRTTIRENVKLAECPSMGEPITSYAPTSAGAEDYRSLAEELMQQEGESHAKAETVKSTIKNDPFASVIPDPSELGIPEVNKEPEQKPVMTRSPRLPRAINTDQQAVAANEPKTGKQKLTVHLASDLADRVKNAAYWEPRLTIAFIAEQGIKSSIEKFEREHGGKYPPREGELVGGRPIK